MLELNGGYGGEGGACNRNGWLGLVCPGLYPTPTTRRNTVKKCRFFLTSSALSRDNDASGEGITWVPGKDRLLTIPAIARAILNVTTSIPIPGGLLPHSKDLYNQFPWFAAGKQSDIFVYLYLFPVYLTGLLAFTTGSSSQLSLDFS